MTDRIVHQIRPLKDGDGEPQPRRFSSFGAVTNIVLLGDPGAGKSHLFREAAEAEGGRYLTARAFLNIPAFPPDSVIFIDALDCAGGFIKFVRCVSAGPRTGTLRVGF